MITLNYESLDKALHNRDDFDCGEDSLNRYLSQLALQHQAKGGAVTHVAVKYNSSLPKIIYGYYTLVNNAIPFDNFPEVLVKGMPEVYPIPTTKIARLARNKIYTEKGFGEYLLIDAIKKILILSKESGVYAIDVDAINEGAKIFYRKYGFVEFLDNTKSMVLTIKTAKKLL